MFRLSIESYLADVVRGVAEILRHIHAGVSVELAVGLLYLSDRAVHRALPYLKKDGVIITNTRETMPMPVITGAAAYPENIVEKLKARANVVALDAMVLALEAGNAKAVNMVLMGVLAARMDLPEEVWQAALTKQVPAKFLELNRRAFALGQAQKGV